MNYPIHMVPFPRKDGPAPALYLRSNRDLDGEGSSIHLEPGGTLSSDTYFGVFPIATWTGLCGLQDLRLSFAMEGIGNLQVKRLGRDAGSDAVLGEWDVADGTTEIVLSQHLGENPGLEAIYFVFTASTPCRVIRAAYETRDRPRRHVALGLIVTTFRRAEIVTGTIKRLQGQIDRDAEGIYGPLELIVVDNGEELDPLAFKGTLVIPNLNMGGAGGFARGLLHLVDSTRCTHACFMDDDASTEEECVLRTRRLLAYAHNERTAISAAMLQSERDHVVHEQGALFVWARNSRIISRKHGLDLLTRKGLIEVLKPEPIRYGGWWFFAFPIRGALKFPYPMFVRGDDWLFSYLNDFEIQTCPGIASWQDSFAGKLSPIEQYLAFKAFLVMELIFREQDTFDASSRFFLRWIRTNSDGYCYDRAEMNLEAFRDVLRGPGFWADNILLGNRLQELKKRITSELDEGHEDAPAPPPQKKYRRGLMRHVRRATFNGHLIPRVFLSPPTAIDKLHAPSPEGSFLREAVAYTDNATLRRFVAGRDVQRYFAIRSSAKALVSEICLSFKKLRADYVASTQVFCTAEWWRAHITGKPPL